MAPSSAASICFSFLASAGLVGTAYLLAGNAASPRAVEASTETELLKALTAEDSDNDGLLNWEESLYGTDPQNPDTKGLGVKDGEAVNKGLIVPPAVVRAPLQTISAEAGGSLSSETLTDLFGKRFIVLYLAAKARTGGVPLSKNQIANLADETYREFSTNVENAAVFKKQTDIPLRGSGQDALKAFAADAERVFFTHSVKVPSDVLTASAVRALRDDDVGAIRDLESFAESMRKTANGLSQLSVPRELLHAHTDLVNTLMRLSSVAAGLASASHDPIGALFAVKQHQETLVAVNDAFSAVESVFQTSNILFEDTEPGALFVSMAKQIQTRLENTP